MLDQFIKTAYERLQAQELEDDINTSLSKLPDSILHKLASGELKFASLLDSCSPAMKWLDQFKGTPFFEQAIALEQEDIQSDIDRQQRRQQDDASYQMSDSIRLKKKLLELDLAKSETEAMAAPVMDPAMDPMATAPPPPPEEPKERTTTTTVKERGAGGESEPAAAAPGPEKMAAKAWLDSADATGRTLANLDVEKLALDMNMVKTLGTKALTKAAPMAQSALGAIAKNPALAGAAVGAVGGAVAGGPDHRLSGAMGGAALGGAAGHFGSGAIQKSIGGLQRQLPVRSGFAAPNMAAGAPALSGAAPAAPSGGLRLGGQPGQPMRAAGALKAQNTNVTAVGPTPKAPGV